MLGTKFFEETLRKLFSGLILFLALPSAASDFVSATHFFPVVSRTAGLGGTDWSTSVQMVNPGTDALTITVRLSADGAYRTETFQLAAGETRAWADFLGNIFDFEGTGALMLEAEADTNGQLPAECRSFAASMRISTGGFGGGSYGQGIPSLDSVSGVLGDWTALFPAVSLWGQPREGGFRTNVGFWNIGAGDAQLRLRVQDAAGQDVWQQVVTVHRHDPFLIGLPRNLDLDTATLVVEPLGGWLDCAVYISVVDNMTGDASFLASQLMDPDLLSACSGGKRSDRSELSRPSVLAEANERLRSLFVEETP